MDIRGKKIVLIAPKYFGYEEYIKQHLIRNGAKVKLIYENLDEINYLYRLAYVYFKNFKDKLCYQYYVKKLTGIIEDVDIIFVIRGSSLLPHVMDKIKSLAPQKCRFVMYQWDGVENNKNALKIGKYFDNIFTFDLKDSIKYGWKYRPLFYIDSLINNMKKRKIDVFFNCSLHSKRVAILNKLKMQLGTSSSLLLKSYIYSKKLIYYKRKYLDRREEYLQANNKDIVFKPLSIKENYLLYQQSKIVVDYTHPDQTGFTMRTIESLGNNCKLITNNKFIMQADFFDENNILIYDGEKIVIPEEFINVPYRKLSDNIYRKYSLISWIEEILTF